jgi:hypothetical protein
MAAAVVTACGLLAPPGGYTGGGDEAPDGGAAILGPASDAAGAPDVVVLPDGNVVPASAGTITVAAGEHEPTSPADDPAWSGDVWSGVLDPNGVVASWRVEPSAPIVGPFDTTAIVSGKWFALGFGLGVGGGRGTALQSTSWKPGPGADWRAAGANMPGGLDEIARAFFGAHVVTVGGVRYQPTDGGNVTVWTDEVHVADVDVAQSTLGGFSDPGVALVHARSRAGVAVVGSYVYVAGGRVPGNLTASVEAAKVDATTGGVAAFAEQPPLQNAGQDHKVFEPEMTGGEGFLFVAGGRNGANALVDVVLSAKIAADGSLGDFQSVTKLPAPVRDFGFVAYKGTLYVLGGLTAQGRTDKVYSTHIAADGTLGAWSTSNASLLGKRSNIVAVAY